MFDVKEEKVVRKKRVPNKKVNNKHRPNRNIKKRKRVTSYEDTNKLKKTGIAMILLIILSIALVIGERIYTNNYVSIKENKTKYLVYTSFESSDGDYSISVPYLNIKGETGTLINDNIDEYVKLFGTGENCNITYEYDISGVFLSLVLKVCDYNSSNVPKVYFRSYVINLNSLDILSDEALYELYGIDKNNVKSRMKSHFYNFYQDIVNEEYFHEEECDFKCFMKYRDVNDYLEDICYYIDKGNLVAYKSFVFTSIYGEEDYFRDDDFKFLIAKGRDD